MPTTNTAKRWPELSLTLCPRGFPLAAFCFFAPEFEIKYSTYYKYLRFYLLVYSIYYIFVSNNKANDMTTHKTSPVKAKSIKKFMKMNGVDVKKCSANGKGGVLVVVAEESREKAIKFFNEFGLNGQPNTSFKHRGTTTNGCWDVGNLYNWVEV